MERDKSLVRRLFCVLLRAGLYPGRPIEEPSTGLSEDVWREIYALCVRQGVVAIVYDGMMRLLNEGVLTAEAAPSRALRLQWALNVERIEQRYAVQRSVIARLAAFYGSHGMRMLLLKGYGLSLLYPRPEHRPCGDIDIWLYGRQAEADALMRREWGTEIDEDVHHHTTFALDGVMVENHYDFINIQSHLSNRTIERRLQELARESGERIEVAGQSVELPSADFNALFLLRHAAMHFAAMEIGMRHVIDWALFVAREHAAIDWEALYDMARRMNMHRFLDSLNALAIDCLGLDAACLPAFERNPELERRVLDDILYPEFSEQAPQGNVLRTIVFRTRRWWANRWKHRIVYNEGLFVTFWVQVRSHLMKPRSLLHR